MTIAEELTQTMEPLLDAVYAAGKEAGGTGGDDLFPYITSCSSLFYESQFPSGYEMVANMPRVSKIDSMFRKVTGIRKLTLNVSIKNSSGEDKVYNAGYFFYGTTSVIPDIEEIVLPDGIKFSDFGRFAGYCKYLKTISGRIDLSENTVTTYCFMYCYALEEVRFVPNTIGVSIDFGHSGNLSDESIASIISGLSCDASGQTLTVHPTVAAKITETDVTDRGWSLAY